MSKLQYQELNNTEAVNPNDIQIWNNDAFDNSDSSPWSPVKPVFLNRQSDSLDSLSSKENQSPLPLKPSIISHETSKPLNPNSLIVNSQGRPTKVLIKPGFVKTTIQENEIEEIIRDEKRIDSEIEEVQTEISRLSSKLEALMIEKSDFKLKMLEKRGRFVTAKFLDQKQSVKMGDEAKRVEENPSSLSAKTRLQRRGVSMGPSEILAKSKQMGKLEITPIQQIQNRRKSCFWKLQEIDELKVIKERGKSSSVSPKSRKTIPKPSFSRQAVTTVGAKKGVKKEETLQIQPKKLFLDGVKSVPVKKPMKPGRVVASRYNQGSVASQANANSAIRKRSLPENEKDEIKRLDKKRASSTGSSIGSLPEVGTYKGSENRIKKCWDITGEIVVHSSVENDKTTPVSDLKVPAILPRIRTMRGVAESPRDSGPAKRVSELIGRKSFFADYENEESAVHELDFTEDDE